MTINIYKSTESLPRFSLDKLVTLKSTHPGVPTGTIIWFGGSTPPTGFLLCNGQSTAGHPQLASVVGANVPDLQGAFIRGYGSQYSYHYGTVLHSSGGLGVQQGDAIRNIVASAEMIPMYGSTGAITFPWGGGGFHGNHTNPAGKLDFNASRVVPIANENRPLSVALLPCIKT